MNTQIINAELVLALRKCLPFVKRHAIISGGDGSLTYSFAVRALADADARQREQEAVKNIVTAEAEELRDSFNRNRSPAEQISGTDAFAQAARAVRPGEGYLPAAPPAKNCTCDTCTQYRIRDLNKFYTDMGL